LLERRLEFRVDFRSREDALHVTHPAIVEYIHAIVSIRLNQVRGLLNRSGHGTSVRSAAGQGRVRICDQEVVGMSDDSNVVVLPELVDEERDQAIFRTWRKGTSIPKLSREYNLPQSHVARILDQHLPQLTPPAQVRELRKLLGDLEELRVTYHDIAVKENDPEAANVAVRTTHEIAQLRMFVGGSAHNDPIQLQRTADPQTQTGSLEAYEHVLARLPKRPPG
jgi:hypothetical protein